MRRWAFSRFLLYIEIKYGLCRLRFSGIDLFLLNAFFPAVRNVGLKLSLELTHPFILVGFSCCCCCWFCLLILLILKEVPVSKTFFLCFFFFFLPYIYKVGFEWGQVAQWLRVAIELVLWGEEGLYPDGPAASWNLLPWGMAPSWGQLWFLITSCLSLIPSHITALGLPPWWSTQDRNGLCSWAPRLGTVTTNVPCGRSLLQPDLCRCLSGC